MGIGLKGETDYLIYLSWKCSKEKLSDSFDTNETFYGVQLLNKRLNSFVIFNQLIQPVKETIFLIL